MKWMVAVAVSALAYMIVSSYAGALSYTVMKSASDRQEAVLQLIDETK